MLLQVSELQKYFFSASVMKFEIVIEGDEWR